MIMKEGLLAEDVFKEMERMMRDFQDFSQQFPSSKNFFPADISDKNREIVLRAEMLGVNEEDIKIRMSGNAVTIAAESKEELNEKKESYYRKERKSRSYQRTFRLPDAVEIDTDNMEANYEQGILELKLPKKKQKKEKEVEVR